MFYRYFKELEGRKHSYLFNKATNIFASEDSPIIQQQKGYYLGLQVVDIGLGTNFGYQFNPNVAVETQIVYSFQASLVGLSVKGILPLSQRTNIYGKAGIADGGNVFGQSGVAATVGLGLGVYASKRLEFNFEANGFAGQFNSVDGRIGLTIHF